MTLESSTVTPGTEMTLTVSLPLNVAGRNAICALSFSPRAATRSITRLAPADGWSPRYTFSSGDATHQSNEAPQSEMRAAKTHLACCTIHRLYGVAAPVLKCGGALMLPLSAIYLHHHAPPLKPVSKTHLT